MRIAIYLSAILIRDALWQTPDLFPYAASTKFMLVVFLFIFIVADLIDLVKKAKNQWKSMKIYKNQWKIYDISL